jgi:Cu/Ag efflux pump CusA
VALGPELRRGIADYNGQGDVVGGIVVMRQGENALNVIHRVKAKLEELKPSMPKGVEVVTTYDRSELIERAIGTVKDKLLEEIIVVSIIILIFLWHFPSTIIPIVTIPVSVALSFILMKLFGLNANLMSLAGIAISIRRRRDEAHRRADGRRAGHLVLAGAARLPGRVLPLEEAGSRRGTAGRAGPAGGVTVDPTPLLRGGVCD